jgi:D-aspartate ligase
MNKPGAIIIEGHVQGLSNTRSLGEMGIPVYVVDKNNCIARYSKYCKKFFQCPDFISDSFVPFLIELAKKENIKDWVLIPSNDHAVYTISKHKERLEQYYKVITPGLEIIDRIYDKMQLIELTKQVGVPVPVTQNFQSVNEKISDDLKFPLLTKGRNGLSFYKATGKKAFLAKTEDELRKQLRFIEERDAVKRSFTQELIPFNGHNKTISFTAFCVQGKIKAHWTGVKLREHPIQFGTATFTKSIYIEACYKHSEKLLKKLQYTGVCEVEYLLDPRSGEYKLIEINPRTWLWVGLAKASGVDYAKIIYDYMQGNEVGATADDLTRYWYNPFTDIVFSMISILKGKLSPGNYVSSLFKKNKVNALFAKGDIKPGFAYFINMFSFLRQR